VLDCIINITDLRCSHRRRINFLAPVLPDRMHTGNMMSLTIMILITLLLGTVFIHDEGVR
jgi:hypothetical protein